MVLMNLVAYEFVDTAGEGEGGMNWESNTDLYTLSCVKLLYGNLLNNTGSPAWFSVITQKDGMGEGDGGAGGKGYTYIPIYIYIYDWFKLLYSRNQHKIAIGGNQLKNK